MTQFRPTPDFSNLRVFLLVSAIAMMTMVALGILPLNAISNQLNAQSVSEAATQDASATDSTSTETNGVQNSSGQTAAAESSEVPATTDEESSQNGQATDDDSDPDSASGTDNASGSNDESWLGNFFHTPPVGYLIQGGLFMWPILLMGIIGAGVIIERYRSLNMLSGDSKQLRTDVQTLLETNQIKEAFDLCNSQQGPVPAILATGLRKYLVLQTLDYEPGKIEEQVVKSMDDYSVHIVAALERHLPILATISSAAPMLGFLGTVQGMIVAFDDIVAKMGETNIVEAAAVGIKVSLMTTCFGLIVGIPAFVAFNYFTGIINRFVLDVEESATEMIEAVTLQTAINSSESQPDGDSAP